MTRATHTGADEVAALARDAIRGLSLYAGADSACAVDVSDNTNLWGTPPAALAAMRELLAGGAPEVARYPRAYSAGLSTRILAHLGLDIAGDIGVVTGCGSDDVLDATMRAFSMPDARIAYSVPTFSMISTFARLNGMEAVEVPLGDDFDVDVVRLLEARAAITYICAPNNPTGTAVSRDAVERILAAAAGIVLVDEAYAEFASGTLVDLVARHPRLLVTRTFSKAFGLAGARVGYGVGSEALTGLVAKARGPYKVNAVGECGAVAALGDGAEARGWVSARVRDAVAMRGYLQDGLLSLGLHPVRSDANFVFVPLRTAVGVAAHMLKGGVRVRAMSGLDGPSAVRAEGGAGLRIGVGPVEQMELVLAALGAALVFIAQQGVGQGGRREEKGLS